MKNPTAFISYSWDNKDHQQWVIKLTNALREKGINATMDVFETQLQTINLNTMMVTKIKDSDYIVIILTETYANKANDLKGGVGFETILTLPYIKNNLKRVVLIMRHNGDYSKVFPFHLQDVYAIDMTVDDQFEDKLEELIYKIYNVPLIHISEVGPSLDLRPKKVLRVEKNVCDDKEELIPRFKEITDLDKVEFLKSAYIHLCELFESYFVLVKKHNPEFDFTIDMISERKSIMYGYDRGMKKVGIKIWRGSNFGSSECILLSFGANLSEGNDGSFNEMITCEVGNNKKLVLKRTMNFSTSISTLS